MCMILYNDRVNAHETASEIEAVIDLDPSPTNLQSLLNADLRNKQAHDELKAYNDNKQFLYVHPFLIAQKAVNKYVGLRREDPSEFMDQLHNAKQSIVRYQSQIKNKKYKSPEELIRWQSYIEEYQDKINQMTKAMQL